MRERCEVPVQKGEINPNPKTSKTMDHSEKLVERSAELDKLKWGQTMEYKVPRK